MWPHTFPSYLYLQIHGLIDFNCSHAKQPARGADSYCINNSMSNKLNTIRTVHKAFIVLLKCDDTTHTHTSCWCSCGVDHQISYICDWWSQEVIPGVLANYGKWSFCLFVSRFLLQCLEDLDASLRKLNSRLFVIRGQPTDVFPRLFKVKTVERKMQSYTFISMLYNTSVINMLYDCNLKQLDHSVCCHDIWIRNKIKDTHPFHALIYHIYH